jgi:hypothetical protein
LVAITILSPAIARTAITDGLVAYWTFDATNETVLYDVSANANHGALYNFPVSNSQWVAGRVGGALSFCCFESRLLCAIHTPA